MGEKNTKPCSNVFELTRIGMKTTQSRTQCDGYHEQPQLKGWICVLERHIKGCCRSSDINTNIWRQSELCWSVKLVWWFMMEVTQRYVHEHVLLVFFAGAKSGRACSTKKNLMAKKANGFNIANSCAAMGATGPLLPSVHGNRHADVAARRRPTSGCRGVVGKWPKFQSAGKRGIGGRLDGVAKMC